MNGETIIIALLKYGMRLGTKKLSYAKNFIAPEKKLIPLLRAIQ